MNIAVQQEKHTATFEYAVFISAMHGSHCPRVRKLCRVLSQLKHGKEEALCRVLPFP
jgi:hypothetical protein